MARGVAAAVFLVSLVLSMTILSGIGYYATLGEAEIDASSQNEDVKQAADELEGIDYDEDRSSAILQGPLAGVIPAIDMLLTLKTIIGNTSGVIQLLFGAPAVVADAIQTFFRLALLITVGFLIRGAVQ